MTPDQSNLEARLHDLATPVDPAVASAHLGAMAGAAPARAGFGTKLKVAAAFFAGLLIGGTGLAAANALPSSAQSVAHTTLAKVGVNVPSGHDRVTDGCGTDTNGQPFKNHGQYVKAHAQDRQTAAQSDCGKPKVSVQSHDSSNDSANCAGQGPTTPTAAADHSKGKATGKATAGSKCDQSQSDTETENETDNGSKPATVPASPNAGSAPSEPGSTNGNPSDKASDEGKAHTDTSVPPTTSTTTTTG